MTGYRMQVEVHLKLTQKLLVVMLTYLVVSKGHTYAPCVGKGLNRKRHLMSTVNDTPEGFGVLNATNTFIAGVV